MNIISHRGNLNGSDVVHENRPDSLLKTTARGFQCEVDVWYCTEPDEAQITPGWYLGHNRPDYPVTIRWLRHYSHYFWYHAKNLKALYRLLADPKIKEVFWHKKDKYTLTKRGYIWTYPNQNVTPASIIVLKGKPESLLPDCNGICTDYPESYRQFNV